MPGWLRPPPAKLPMNSLIRDTTVMEGLFEDQLRSGSWKYLARLRAMGTQETQRD